MKKLSVLFVSLVALASVISCNKDDDNNDENKPVTIEGKWERTHEGETLETLEKIVQDGGCGNETMELLSGSKFNVNGFDFIESQCKPYSGTGTWSLKQDNKYLSISEDGETTLFEILELSSTQLKLKETDEEGVWITVYIRK